VPAGVDRQSLVGLLLPLARSPAARDVEVQAAFVEPLAFADRKQLQRVVVVRDHRDVRVDGCAVDGQIEAFAVPGEQEQRTELGKGLVPAPVALAAVHEVGVEPQRDVVQENALGDASDVDRPLPSLEGVQGADRVVAVETQVAREVVARPERDADERQLALERNFGDRGERAVTARDAERVSVGRAGELGGVVAGAQDPRFDSAFSRRLEELFRARRAGARARVDEK
jgi:hypothetical protein